VAKWNQLFVTQPSFVRIRSASADYGEQPSLKLRLASRSFSEGWWRWRESEHSSLLKTLKLLIFQPA
jgi:hypothetical protein